LCERRKFEIRMNLKSYFRLEAQLLLLTNSILPKSSYSLQVGRWEEMTSAEKDEKRKTKIQLEGPKLVQSSSCSWSSVIDWSCYSLLLPKKLDFATY